MERKEGVNLVPAFRWSDCGREFLCVKFRGKKKSRLTTVSVSKEKKGKRKKSTAPSTLEKGGGAGAGMWRDISKKKEKLV